MREDRLVDGPDQLEEYLRERESSESSECDQDSSVRMAVFRIDEQLYAMSADGLKQVCKVESIARVPGCPSVIAGLVQVGGEIIGLVDVAEFLNASHRFVSQRGHALVYQFGNERIGLLVSAVEEVVDVPVREISELGVDRDLAYAVSEILYDGQNVPFVDLQRALSSLLDPDEEMPV